jgi:signal transduction histidine kinase
LWEEIEKGNDSIIQQRYFICGCDIIKESPFLDEGKCLQIQGTEFLNEENGNKSIFLVFTDITYLRNLDEAKAQAKEMAMATITHELRTPTNGIISMLQLLKNKNLSQDQFSKCLRVSLSSAFLLLNLINEIMV